MSRAHLSGAYRSSSNAYPLASFRSTVSGKRSSAVMPTTSRSSKRSPRRRGPPTRSRTARASQPTSLCAGAGTARSSLSLRLHSRRTLDGRNSPSLHLHRSLLLLLLLLQRQRLPVLLLLLGVEAVSRQREEAIDMRPAALLVVATAAAAEAVVLRL